MKKLYFCYEHSSIGWTPVVYHDDKPAKSVNGSQPERTALIEVPQEFIGNDGEPMFSKLIKAYPLPE